MQNSEVKQEAPPIVTMGDVLCIALRLLIEARLNMKYVADIVRMTPRTLSSVLNRTGDTILGMDTFHTLWTSVLKLKYEDLDELKKDVTIALYVSHGVHISDYAGPKWPDAKRMDLDQIEDIIRETIERWARSKGHLPREYTGGTVVNFHRGE